MLLLCMRRTLSAARLVTPETKVSWISIPPSPSQVVVSTMAPQFVLFRFRRREIDMCEFLEGGRTLRGSQASRISCAQPELETLTFSTP